MTTATAECPAIETPPPVLAPTPAPAVPGLHCIVAREALLRALILCAAVAPTRCPKPILACVKLTAAQGRLQLCATDLERSICLSMPDSQAAVEHDGEVAVPLKDLLGIVRKSADATLTLDLQEDHLYVRGTDARFKLATEDVACFPPLPQVAGDPAFEVDADALTRMIGQTLYACARESTRYAQNCVLVERQGNALSLVATDGYRLAISTGDCQTISTGTQTAMVPLRTMAVLAKLLGKPTASRRNTAPLPVKVYVREHDAIFVVGDATLAATLTEGNFPPYREVIPALGSITADVVTAELVNGLERAMVWADGTVNSGVKLSFTSDMLIIRPFDKDLADAEIHVPVANYQGEPLEIGFNPRFLLEGVAATGTERIQLNMRMASKPAMFRTHQFLYVVMSVGL